MSTFAAGLIGFVVVVLMIIIFIIGFYLGAACEVKRLVDIDEKHGDDACIEKLYHDL